MNLVHLFIILASLVRFSIEVEYQNRLCFDGVIDAAFSVALPKILVLFKGKNVYQYTFEEVNEDQEQTTIRHGMQFSFNNKILNSKKFIKLKYKSEQLFSDFCNNEFFLIDKIASAFYDESKSRAFLVESGNKNSVIEVLINDELKFECSSKNYSQFKNDYKLKYDFEQVLYLDNKRIVFMDKILFINHIHSNGSESIGVGLTRAIDINFPKRFNAIFVLENKIWIFKEQKILIFEKIDFKAKIDKLQNIELEKVRGVCESKSIKFINVTFITLFDDQLIQEELPNNTFKTILILKKFNCCLTGSDLILGEISILAYFSYHLYAFLLLIILILLIYIFVFLMISFVQKNKEKIKMNFYIEKGEKNRSNAKHMPKSDSDDEVTSIRLPIGSKSNKISVRLTKFRSNLSSYFKKDLTKNLPETGLENITVSKHMEHRSSLPRHETFQERSI